MANTFKLNGFYVYVLLDLRKTGNFDFGGLKFNSEPYYVGKGSGRRCFKHFEESEFKRPYNKHKNNITKKILEQGFLPKDCVMLISDNLSEKDSLDLEKEVISKIGTISLKTGPLSNKNDGGESPGSHIRGKTWNESWGEQRANERRMELSQQKAERLRIKAEIKKNLPPKPPKERDLSWCQKKVIRIDKHLSVERFASISEAGRISKMKSSGINNALSSRTEFGTSGGFVWIYETKFNEMSEMEIKKYVRDSFSKKESSRRMVAQIDPIAKQIIRVFSSRAEAATEMYGTRKRAGDIAGAIKSKSLTGGFLWEDFQ
jgi:hypothetical protein